MPVLCFKNIEIWARLHANRNAFEISQGNETVIHVTLEL